MPEPQPRDPSLISPAVTVTLLALIVVYRVHGSASVREVALVAGQRSAGMVHAHLVKLRRAGLVDWEPGKIGTLRPLVELVDGPWVTDILPRSAERHPSSGNTRAVRSRSHDLDHDDDRTSGARPGPRGEHGPRRR